METNQTKDKEKKDFSKIDQKIEAIKKEESESNQKDDLKTLCYKAVDHIKNVKSEVLKYSGKIGYNPFIWLRDKHFVLAQQMIDYPASFAEIDIRTTLLKVINTKAEPPIAMPVTILSVKETLRLTSNSSKKENEK